MKKQFYGGVRGEQGQLSDPRTLVKIYMPSSQRSLLHSRAKEAGKSVSLYVRDRLFFAPVGGGLDKATVADIQLQLRTLVRQIQGEATNINQIAYHANSTSTFPEEADNVSQALREQVRALRELHEQVGRLL